MIIKIYGLIGLIGCMFLLASFIPFIFSEIHRNKGNARKAIEYGKYFLLLAVPGLLINVFAFFMVV